jgi:uncharacterized protein YbaP (TraB family)
MRNVRSVRWLAALLATACATPPAPLPPCAPGTAGVPLAFELHAPDGRTAFLQGSVHLAREAEAPLDPRALQALRASDVLVGELDMRDFSQLEMAQLTFELGRLPEGQSLADVIAPETHALLVERAEDAGLPLAPLESFEPWVVALSFIGLSLVQAGFKPEEGVEHQVFRGERPEATRGLETISEQLALFDELSPASQEAMLLDALRPTAENMLELEAMFAAWRCGDAAGLEAVLGRMSGANPAFADFYDATIFRRNETLAEGVEQVVAESERAFIVVGALHLVGARGIPALLAKAGYRIEQLRSD